MTAITDAELQRLYAAVVVDATPKSGNDWLVRNYAFIAALNSRLESAEQMAEALYDISLQLHRENGAADIAETALAAYRQSKEHRE